MEGKNTVLLTEISGAKDLGSTSNKPEGQVVIGILTLPSTFGRQPMQQYSMIVRAYVQYLQETNKAITVPIHWDSTDKQLDSILSQVNGVLLTGGAVQFMDDLSIEQKYLQTATYIVEKSKQCSHNGDYFPVWGTCLGFQIFGYICAGNDLSVMQRYLGDFDNHNVYNIDKQSKLFKKMPSDLIEWLQKSRPVYYSHNDAIRKESAKEFKGVSDNLAFTSLSKTNDGVEFVATLEYKNYPIYGVQFHPEKNLFEKKAEGALRDPQSLRVNSYFRDFFIEECFKNKHTFKDKNELQNLRLDKTQWVSSESSYYSAIYFMNNMQNPDVDYYERYIDTRFGKIYKKK